MKYTDPPSPAMTPLLAALLFPFFCCAAQAAEQVIPGAGAILQQIAPVKPALPLPPETGLTIQHNGAGALPPSAPFAVKRIDISGNTLFATSLLQALVADAQGENLTLPQLGERVARITEYYRSHGYPLARALVPAQTIRDGVVAIDVIEGRYGKIHLDNSSRVSDALLRATLAPLQGGQAVAQAPMDHALLLLSDIPGVSVRAVLKPGEGVGTADLLVDATPAAAFSGNAALDNDGNRYTGRARIGATLNFLNGLHRGDVLGVSGLSSGSAMNYARLSYDALLNGQGSRLGGAYSALHYVLGAPLAALDAHGTAQVATLWVRHPLLRSREWNLYAQLQHESLQLRDHVDASALKTDRHLNDWTMSLSGDASDALLAGAVSSWNLGWTTGRVGFDDAVAQSADASTARVQGRFSKWNASLARQQNLTASNGLYLSFSGQWANSNLDASQKMSAGGPYAVRAYDVSAATGDAGYLASAEWRRDLGAAWGGQWQAVAFADSAHVTVNKSVWSAGGNSATLSGAGLGVNCVIAQAWGAKAFVAKPLGAHPALVGDTASARAWVEISRRF